MPAFHYILFCEMLILIYLDTYGRHFKSSHVPLHMVNLLHLFKFNATKIVLLYISLKFLELTEYSPNESIWYWDWRLLLKKLEYSFILLFYTVIYCGQARAAPLVE